MFESKDKRIGLIGGSFDPAHEGHIHLAEKAIEFLQLDKVVMILSQKNPLKEPTMYEYEERFLKLKSLASDNDKIIISKIEDEKNYKYSYQVIEYFLNEYQDKEFVWLLGADHLSSFQQWKNYRQIIGKITIAIFARDEFLSNVDKSVLNQEFKEFRVDYKFGLSLNPAKWFIMDIEKNPQSSTKIRALHKKKQNNL